MRRGRRVPPRVTSLVVALLVFGAGACRDDDVGAHPTVAAPTPNERRSPRVPDPPSEGPDPRERDGVTTTDDAPLPNQTPWSIARFDAALSAADDELHQLGAYRHAHRTHRGPQLDARPELAEAYAQGRAMNWRGTFTEIQQWSGLAKFGAKEPGGTLTRGPLAGWNLTVVTEGSRAYLHAWLGPHGPVDGTGTHERLDDGTRWIALCDVLEPGAEYLPFKRDDSESVHHQWGRADVVADLASLARDYHQRTGVPLGIGDISHITGGKLRGHWTHQLGVDADLYLLSFPDREHDTLGEPINYVFAHQRGRDVWSTRRDGRGQRAEPTADGTLVTERRLATLAELALPNDAIAYFVHDATSVLAPFDAQAQQRRVGRRYLHRRNQGFWPHHPDHVHLRWVPVEIELPRGTPRP